MIALDSADRLREYAGGMDEAGEPRDPVEGKVR